MQIYKISYLESIGEFEVYHEELAVGTLEQVEAYAQVQLQNFYDEDTVVDESNEVANDDTGQRSVIVESITPTDSIGVVDAQTGNKHTYTININKS